MIKKEGTNMNKNIAFITGATRGIGKQIAITLAKNGFDIALNYRTENDDLKSAQEEIKNFGVDCLAVQGDVSNFEECGSTVASETKRG